MFRLRARLYRRGTADAAELDRLLDRNQAGDVRLDSDRIVVVGHGNGRPLSGVLAWRPCGLIHELVIEPNATRRLAAQALVNYALGDARAFESRPSQAVFLVDKTNVPMLRFVREFGAVEQSDDRSTVFTLDL